jgi:hypothetical protein
LGDKFVLDWTSLVQQATVRARRTVLFVVGGTRNNNPLPVDQLESHHHSFLPWTDFNNYLLIAGVLSLRRHSPVVRVICSSNSKSPRRPRSTTVKVMRGEGALDLLFVANLERDSLPRSADDDDSVGADVIDSWEEHKGGIVGTAVVCLVGNG